MTGTTTASEGTSGGVRAAGSGGGGALSEDLMARTAAFEWMLRQGLVELAGDEGEDGSNILHACYGCPTGMRCLLCCCSMMGARTATEGLPEMG